MYPWEGVLSVSVLTDRITVNPEQCGGRPCVRGLRIRVTDVLDLLAEGLVFLNGRMHAPDKPGLGVELDEAALKRYRVDQ